MYTVKNIRFETRDDYGRKAIAERVLKLIEQGENNSPLFIDGAWGSGKSEFCYKLFHFLKDSNEGKEEDSSSKLIVSYINSFAGDYQRNPFMLIVQAIYNSLITGEVSSSEVESIQGKLSKGLNFARTLLTAGFRGTSLKIAPPLTGVELEIKGGAIIDAVKGGIEESNEEFKVAFFDELENFRLQSEQLMQFKSAISDAMDGKKIILIIDELDRCRPDYALELLENVKHIFEIEDLFIIFSANKKQLEAIIHKKYGYGIDAEGYLEKFYKKSIFLTSVIPVKAMDEEHNFIGHLNVFFSKLGKDARNLGIKSELNIRGLDFVKELLGTLEPRRVESIAESLNNYFALKENKLEALADGHLSILIFGVYLFVVKPEILRDIEGAESQVLFKKHISELSISDMALQKLNSYMGWRLDNIGDYPDEINIDNNLISVLVDVRNVLL